MAIISTIVDYCCTIDILYCGLGKVTVWIRSPVLQPRSQGPLSSSLNKVIRVVGGQLSGRFFADSIKIIEGRDRIDR